MTRSASPNAVALAALLIAAGQALAPEARATTWPNAQASNGLHLNGLGINGLGINGLQLNGRELNAPAGNAIAADRANDDAAAGRGFADHGGGPDPNRLRLRAIVLPGETAAAAAE